MDRIRQALDLARQERGLPPEEPVEVSFRAFDNKSVARMPRSIVYTKTRTFSPPVALLEANRIVGSASREPAAAAFRMLRTQVLQRMEEHQWQSLAILSPVGKDGKTTTAINLAISLANDHRHTVLLVDLDLKRPTIAAKLGIVPEVGTDDILQGSGRIEDCLYHPEGFERLVVLPARGPLHNSSEALAGPRGRQLVAELRGRYPDRIIVFDLPPVLGADDAVAFAPLVECGLVVVAEGLTSRDDVLRCMELLRKTTIVGTVLNRSTDGTSPYN